MAINRAPFNALVDDDGSNSLGTPWNKAAIAGVILDPVDAAITAAVGAVPLAVALIGSGNGNTTSAAAENVTFVTAPQLGPRDTIVVQLTLAFYAASGVVVSDLVLVPGGTTFVDSVTLGGTTGAGDLTAGTISSFRIVLMPSTSNTIALATGVVTSGTTQIRGFTYARASVANFVAQAGNLVGLRQYGIVAGGNLHWTWAVHLVKG